MSSNLISRYLLKKRIFPQFFDKVFCEESKICTRDDKYKQCLLLGLPSYFLEGFLFVQQALDLTIMDMLGIDTNALKFEVQRMPYPPYLDDTFVGVLEGFLAMLFLLCFIFMTFNIVKNLVVEKEKRLKVCRFSKSFPFLLSRFTFWSLEFSLFGK